jgi:catechol 2,3-dioxygenase-like lactoylglutathione lyase family enzyme
VLVGIHHTALSTPDLDRLVRWYRDRFGFEVSFVFDFDESNENFQRTHAERETRGRVAMLERDGSRLEIFEYARPVPRPADPARRNVEHGICHFSFEVKEIEAEYARLRAEGVRFQSEPVPQSNIKCCYLRDPDGNIIELIEYFDRDVEAEARQGDAH